MFLRDTSNIIPISVNILGTHGSISSTYGNFDGEFNTKNIASSEKSMNDTVCFEGKIANSDNIIKFYHCGHSDEKGNEWNDKPATMFGSYATIYNKSGDKLEEYVVLFATKYSK